MSDYRTLKNNRNSLNTFAIENKVEVVDIHEGYTTCKLALDTKHFNVVHTVDSGALYTLMDSAGSALASSYGKRVTTVNASVEFLNAVRKPTTIFAVARTVKNGHFLTVVDVDARVESGKIYAKGTFTFYNLPDEKRNLEN